MHVPNPGLCARADTSRSARRGRRPGVRGRAAIVLCLLSLAAPPTPGAAQDPTCAFRVVEHDELTRAMRSSRGYDLGATTNAPRLGAEVFLELARRAVEAGDLDGLLMIRQRDWLRAFLEVTGLTESEAPPGARMAAEHRQDMLIEYRPDRVVQDVLEGPVPRVALAVQAFWSRTPDGPTQYSFEDTLSVPKVRATSQRIVRYRLLEYDDMIVYDTMDGLKGRPLGWLGFFFKLFGDASVRQSRYALAEDGVQVMRASAKWLTMHHTVATIDPDGTAQEGTRKGRPDLEEIEARLEREVRVTYRPFPCVIE